MAHALAVGLKQQLISLDRAVIGKSYDARNDLTPRWVSRFASIYPIMAGGVSYAVFAYSRAAGVGMLIGLVLAMPLVALAKVTARGGDSSSERY